MKKLLRIGTRDSELALWQASTVRSLLQQAGVDCVLVPMKSEGDKDTITPIYAMGVQGLFTKTLDAALLNNRIDIAVHSMKDVPTTLAQGIKQAAVLKRASYKDILVYKGNESSVKATLDGVNEVGAFVQNESLLTNSDVPFTIATGSVRRVAQWLHRFPAHKTVNLRGNVNTRLRKLEQSSWNGAIFAAAGLERINLRPQNSIDLDWMLPAPSQGAIMVVCREEDNFAFESCQPFNHEPTALCAQIEKDFLRVLMGGCSTPISALAQINEDGILFKGNICSVDGAEKIEVSKETSVAESNGLGATMAAELLTNPKAEQIIYSIRNESN